MDQIDPQIAAAEAQRDRQVLEYHPQLERPKPPGVAAGGGPATVAGTTGVIHVADTLVINLLATWSDIQAVGNWFATTLPAYRAGLQDRTVAIQSDALNTAEQQLLRTALGKDTLSFGEVYDAYLHPENPYRSLILQTWDRQQWSYDGSIDAQLYLDLDRLHAVQYPIISDTARNLIALVGHAMLGNDASLSTDEHLQSLAAAAGTLTHPHEQISGYLKLQDTIAAQTSELNYAAAGIQQAINAQVALPAQGIALLTDLTSAIDTSGSGVGVALGRIIGTLQGLKVLFELYNAQNWLSFSALRTRLDQLVQDLILRLVAQAASAYAHIENQLAFPLINLVRDLDHVFGGRHTTDMDKALDSLVTLISSVVGKFEQHLLDMYRHTWLHNDLTAKSTNSVSQNNNVRNLVKTIDTLISALTKIQGEIHSFDATLASVSNELSSISGKTVQLPQVASLSITKPHPQTTLAQAAAKPAGSWGLTTSGQPGDVASNLLEQIRGRASLG